MKTEIAGRIVEEIDQNCKNLESQPLLIGNEKDRLIGDVIADNKKAKNIWKDSNLRQKSILIYVSIVNYISFLCFSSCSSFFARVMLQKGGTVVLSTVVLQITMVTSAISAIIFGKYQTRIGSKTLILSGQVLFGFCQIAFGSIGYIENYWVFMAVGTILRALQGTCQAALNVAGLTIVCWEFPDFISTVFGIFEAAYGAGYLSGPYVGGFLFDWSNGMMAPMVITGLLCLLYASVGFAVLKEIESRQNPGSHSHVRRILSNPKAVFIVGTGGTIIGGFGLCDATITMYLKKEGFSATKVGQLLFLMGVGYCLFSVSIGFAINSRKMLRRLVISIGILGGFAFPFLWVPNQLETWIYVAAFGYAVCAAITFIPAFDELRHTVDSDGASASDMSLNSALSGIWSSSISLCNFTGPLIGSALEMSFPYYAAFVASLLIACGFTLFLTLISAFYRQICTT